MRRPGGWTVAWGCAMLALAGCGGGKAKSATTSTGATSTSPAAGAPVGAPQYEAKLKQLLSGGGAASGAPPGSAVPQPPTTPVSAVTCPAGLKPAQGVSFTCQVTGEKGLSGSVVVTPDDSTAKTFHYKGRLKSSTVTQTVSGNSTIG